MIGLGAGKIEFFRSLSNAAESGVPLQRAVSILTKGRTPVSRAVLDDINTKLESGRPLSEAMAGLTEFTPWQTEIVRVGEATGRLDNAFKTIAEILEERRSFALTLLSGLAYPLFLLHIAPLFLYGSLLISANVFSFLFSVIGFLLWFYVPVGLIYLAWKKGVLSSLPLPFVATFSKAQFCFYLAGLIQAAVPLRKALELSAQASGLDAVADGEPGESATIQLRRYKIFADEELARIEVAEESGKLGQDLTRLAVQSQQKWQAGLKAASAVLPVIIYLVIALSIAYRILSFYNNYFDSLNSVFR